MKGFPENNKEIEQPQDNNNPLNQMAGGPNLGNFNQNFPLHM